MLSMSKANKYGWFIFLTNHIYVSILTTQVCWFERIYLTLQFLRNYVE